MANPIKEGIPALHKYQSVKYYPFEVEPGCSLVLVSDPWSYVYAYLKKRSIESRGKNRACLNRAVYFSELAADFYRASAATTLPTKGMLSYYGMLNLAKAFLSEKGVELEKYWEHHGLSIPLGKGKAVTVKKITSGISIFQDFSRALGKPVTGEETYPIKDLFAHIPEIHEICFTLGLLPWAKRKYLPISIHYLVNSEKNKVFTEMRYEKRNEERVDTSRFYKGAREQYFKELIVQDSNIRFRSKARKLVDGNNWPRIYRNINNEYAQFNIVSLLTREGYKHYCDLRPGPFHHMAYMLAIMFYIGSVARYRPTETEELLRSEFRPIISESTETLPNQFLYQMVSYITKSVCVIPQASLK